ncbi:STAS domain-containing protein [Burkholderiaceae bacterium DAT-1]|nr:STAS domain-containing protein [Burkholderiaceae bacterium DAT-1]
MTLGVEEKAGIRHLTLDGELTISTVSALKSELIEAAQSDSVLFDPSQLSDIDSCGVQWLALLHQEATRQGRAFHVLPGHASLDHILKLLGLSNILSPDTPAKAEQ